MFNKIKNIYQDFDLWMTKLYIRSPFAKKFRMKTYRKLMTFISTSIPLIQALNTMYKHVSNDGKSTKSEPTALKEWLENHKNGMSFSESLRGWVPESEITYISSGEKENMKKSLEKLLYVMKNKSRVSKSFLGLIYPVFLFGALFGMIVIFNVKVFPEIIYLLPVEEWNGYASVVYYIGQFLINNIILLSGVFVAFIALIWYSLANWTGKTRVFFDKFPPWSLYKLWNATDFMLSYSSQLNAGLAEKKIIISLKENASPWYEEKLDSILLSIRTGRLLGDALYESGYNFPDKEVITDLRTFSGLDNFSENLNILATEWLEENIVRVESSIRMISGIALILLFVVTAILMSAMQTVQQQAITF